VCGIDLFCYLTYVYFGNFVSGRHIVNSVNNISWDKGGAWKPKSGYGAIVYR